MYIHNELFQLPVALLASPRQCCFYHVKLLFLWWQINDTSFITSGYLYKPLSYLKTSSSIIIRPFIPVLVLFMPYAFQSLQCMVICLPEWILGSPHITDFVEKLRWTKTKRGRWQTNLNCIRKCFSFIIGPFDFLLLIGPGIALHAHLQTLLLLLLLMPLGNWAGSIYAVGIDRSIDAALVLLGL